jgi:hypothetical protein
MLHNVQFQILRWLYTAKKLTIRDMKYKNSPDSSVNLNWAFSNSPPVSQYRCSIPSITVMSYITDPQYAVNNSNVIYH